MLPILDTLKACLHCFRVSIEIPLLILTFSFTSTLIATDFLKGFWNKCLVAYKANAIPIHLVGMIELFRGLKALMTGFAKSNEIIHTIVFAHSCRNFMMNVKGTPVLFRCFTAHLAYLVTFTDCSCYLVPSVTIEDSSTPIVPMVFTFSPSVHMSRVYKEDVPFAFPLPPSRDTDYFTASASAFNSCAWFGFCLAQLCFYLIREMFAVKVVVLSNLDRLFAFIRETCDLALSKGCNTLKRFAANDTGLLYTVCFLARTRAELAIRLRRDYFNYLATLKTGDRAVRFASSVVVMLTKLSSLFTCFRSTRYLLNHARLWAFKHSSADDTRLLYVVSSTLMGFVAIIRAELSWSIGIVRGGFTAIQTSEGDFLNRCNHDSDPLVSGYSSFSCGRPVTKLVLSVGDQPAQAYSIIQQLRGI